MSEDFGCARFDDGSLQCWGSNLNGQTGRDDNNTKLAGPVHGVHGVAQIAIGQSTVVRTTDGAVWGWGANMFGELGTHNSGGANPAPVPELFGAEQISTSIMTCALRRDVITCIGTPLVGSSGVDPKTQHFDGHGVRTLAAGCLVMVDGTLECWGANSEGEVGVGDKQPRAEPSAVLGLSGVAGVALGGQFTCAVRDNGSAYCWGKNSIGQLGTGDTTDRTRPDSAVIGVPPLKSVTAGLFHACGLGEDGLVYCWGDDGTAQLGFIEKVEAPNPTPRRIAGVSHVVALSAGTWATCALEEDHTIWCWGENTSGGLGAGFASDVSATPLKVKLKEER